MDDVQPDSGRPGRAGTTETTPATADPAGSAVLGAAEPGRRVARIPATGRAALGCWLASRLLTLAILATPAERDIIRDVRYYGNQLGDLFQGTPVTEVLREYPAPSFAVFVPPRWLAELTHFTYASVFVALMIAIDAAFTLALWRSGGRRSTPGLRLWLLLVPCLGPLTFTRFDLVSAALAGAAMLALAARRPMWSGVLAAAGAAVKLWPAGLLPALLVRRDRPGRVLAGFAGLGAIAVIATLLGGGVTRLLSPLTWQGERGLQLETIWAVPLLWGRAVSPDTWSTPYTRFFAFQIEGPGVAALTRLSTIATVAAVALLVALSWRAWRATGPDRPAGLPLVGMLAIAAACLLIVPNKTLSPQYLLWLAGLLAALGAVAPDEPLIPRLNVMLVLSCLLTQILYPLGYGMLTGPDWSNVIGAALLTARNALLLVITVLAVRRALELTRRAPA
jgi:hypothetical protein